MLRVDLGNARPGMELAMPVRHPRAVNQVLLKVGYVLEPNSVQRLLDLGVRLVWVRYPSLNFLEKYVSQEVVQAQGGLIQDIAQTFEIAQRQANAKMNYERYTNSIGRLVAGLVSNPQAALFLGDLGGGTGGTRDDGAAGLSGQMMRHSSTVTYLSLLMGLKLEGYLVKQRKHMEPARAKEVTNLGIGAMLHDIGVMHLPEEVRTRHQNRCDETDPQWREHPTIGYRLVRGSIEPSAATVVLNHHQRVDGTGYAGGDTPALEGSRIHIFARIVAVADEFDEQQHPPNGESRPTAAVLAYFLQEPVARQFDPRVLQALFAVIPPFPPGSILRLNDGRYATALDHNANEPCRPVVQIIVAPGSLTFSEASTRAAETGFDDPAWGSATSGDVSAGDMLDLAQCPRDLKVIECDGRDVRPFLFNLPAWLRSDQLAAQWS